MATFINPFVDRGFKRLFGQEDSKELLIDLLNGLFEGERVITELSFLNVEMPAESTDSRAAVFDLKCKDKRVVFLSSKYKMLLKLIFMNEDYIIFVVLSAIRTGVEMIGSLNFIRYMAFFS